ncbi:MAG: NADAR family protein [Patescibacteria group bacterium]
MAKTKSASQREPPILFYGQHHEYTELSNFYPAVIEIAGKQYPTVEHYFQAMKAPTRGAREVIRTASTPAQAKRLGWRVELPKDWEQKKIGVMKTALLAKFTQHADLQSLLLATGDRVIHEDSPTDAVWGWLNGQGQDLLGRLLMQVRAAIRKNSLAL